MAATIFARGSQRGIRFITEIVWGTTPTTPNMKKFRSTGDTMQLSRQNTQSAELRSDRQITDFRSGNFQSGGDINFELSYGALDDMIESAMLSLFAVAYNVTAQTITVVASAKTFTRSSGDFIADGVEIGDYITFGGYVAGGDNGTFKVSNVSTSVVTCSTAAGLVDETGTGNETFTTTKKKIKTGTVLKSLSVEKAHLDIGEYIMFPGCAVSSLKLSVKPNAIVTGGVTLMGKTVTIAGTTYATGGLTEAPTNPPFDSFTGSILEGGTPIAIVTGLDISLSNGFSPTYVLMDKTAQNLVDGRSNLTGSFTLYFADGTMLGKWYNETASSLQFKLTDLSGNTMRFTAPKIKFGGGDLPTSGEGPITLTMPFQAIFDPVTGTNFIIENIPA